MIAPAKRSAGFIVVRESRGGMRFLLLRVYRNWDFPKGLVESGELPLEAARRETAEEAGITELELAWGEDFVETAPYSGNKIARYYLGRTQTERVVLQVNPALGRPEHHEFRWVSLDEAVALLPPRLQSVIAWAARRLSASH